MRPLQREQSAVADGADNVSDGFTDMADTANTTAEAAHENAKGALSGAGECWRRICHRCQRRPQRRLSHWPMPTRRQRRASRTPTNQSSLTGSYAGTSAGRLAAMAASLAKVNGTRYEAVAALSEIASTGKFTVEQIERSEPLRLLYEATPAGGLQKPAAEFSRLADDPVKGVAAAQ
ncbi:phage tail length tape measure family protein [Pseudomonas aeruginosa]|nr:phage tail length tape measure family protein [Pseudomonas aeruginosa]